MMENNVLDIQNLHSQRSRVARSSAGVNLQGNRAKLHATWANGLQGK
jgi:hypothetical protein